MRSRFSLSRLAGPTSRHCQAPSRGKRYIGAHDPVIAYCHGKNGLVCEEAPLAYGSPIYLGRDAFQRLAARMHELRRAFNICPVIRQCSALWFCFLNPIDSLPGISLRRPAPIAPMLSTHPGTPPPGAAAFDARGRDKSRLNFYVLIEISWL